MHKSERERLYSLEIRPGREFSGLVAQNYKIFKEAQNIVIYILCV